MFGKKILDKAIIVIVSIIIFYTAILIFSDFDVISEKINEINYQFFPIIFSLIGLNILIHSIKYHRLLQQAKIKLPFSESFKIYLAGISMHVTPGTMGTAIKSHILKSKHKISMSSSLPIIYFEKWTELLAILIIVTILLFWTFMYESVIAIILGYCVVGIFIILSSSSKSFSYITKFLQKIKFLRKFTENLDESKATFQILNSKRNVLEGVGWSVLAKISQLLAIFLIFLSLDVQWDVFLIGQIFYTSVILGTLSFIPAGIIVVEASMLGLLVKNGLEFSVATILVVLVRLITTWLVVVLGAITLKHVLSNNPKKLKQSD